MPHTFALTSALLHPARRLILPPTPVRQGICAPGTERESRRIQAAQPALRDGIFLIAFKSRQKCVVLKVFNARSETISPIFRTNGLNTS